MSIKDEFKPDIFYQELRKRSTTVFGTSLSQSQVDGLNAILAEGMRRNTPKEWMADILATTYHESAHTMQPVRETLALTDDEAIRRLDNAYAKGKLPWVKTPYWRRDADGKTWLGRGYPQLTHKANYAKMSKLVGVDLVLNPEKAMDLRTALDILFIGMERGAFTGRKLSDVFDCVDEDDNEELRELIASRAIINGHERAELIAGYGLAFLKCLTTAGWPSKTQPELIDVPIPGSTPLTPTPPVTTTTSTSSPAKPRTLWDLIRRWFS